MNKNKFKGYKILEGYFPILLEELGTKEKPRSKVESITYGLHKTLGNAGFDVYGPYTGKLIGRGDFDLYNVQNIRRKLSATLITLPLIPALPCEIYIIGSEYSQDTLAKVLSLKKVKRKYCDCDFYWCAYKNQGKN